jgi:glycosyltransferase involved in cell wall biosynthesis
MKIGIVVHNITNFAGIERAVCNLVNLLTGFDPIIISIQSDSGIPKYQLKENIPIYHLNIKQENTKIKKVFGYFRTIREIRQIDADENFDSMIGTGHDINVLLTFVRKNLKIIGCEHFGYGAVSLLSRTLRKIFYRRLETIVVLTIEDAEYYVFHKNVRVIPNALSFMPEQRSNLDAKRILVIGRLSYQKGFDMLISAIFLIKEQCIGWEVKIIGGGEDEEPLKKQICDLGIDNIITIHPPNNKILDEYLNASIFVLSSRFEGLPMVLIEAQGCGLPAVSFNCPTGPGEIIEHNKNGLLVEPGNIKQLSKSIAELIVNTEERKAFGANALKSSERYRPEKIFLLWNELLNSIKP